MFRKKTALVALGAMVVLAGCSQETEQNASEMVERAAQDTEANLDVAGEVIEDGAIDAADSVSKGAANLRDDLEAGDEEEPGPAPITGDDLGS